MEWREGDGIRWLEADLGSARAAFSTRGGGVSEPPYDSLNLGLLTHDAGQNVIENRRRLAAALGHDPSRIRHGHQVHGPEFSAEGGGEGELLSQAPDLDPVDGHVIRRPGEAGLVLVADCLPVAFAGPGGVAIAHCGWRGLAAGIVERAARATAAVRAAIGPGIGPCCYEVGDAVGSEFNGLGPVFREGTLDLPGVARRLLSRAGVEQVEQAGLCTSCEPDLFFSHRRDAGRTGRQAGLAWVTADATA